MNPDNTNFKTQLGLVLMKTLAKYNQNQYNACKPILPQNGIALTTSEHIGYDRVGSTNVSSGRNVGRDLYTMCSHLLGVTSLYGKGFFEVGMGDGLISQYLSRIHGIVSIGCEASPGSFKRWHSSYQSMLKKMEEGKIT